MRYLLGLVLVAALVAGGLFIYAGQLPGPAIEIAKPTKYVGQTTTVEVTLRAPGAQVGRRLPDRVRAGRQADAARVVRQPGHRRDQAGGGPRARHADLRPRHDPGPQERAGAHRRHRRAPGALRHAEGEVDGLARRPGAAREADDRRALDQALRQSRRLGDGRVSRDARRRRVGRAGRRPEVSGLSGERGEARRRQHRGSRGQDRLHRAPLRPGRQHADVRLREATKRATRRAPISIA